MVTRLFIIMNRHLYQFILLLFLLVFTNEVKAQYSLYVGESEYIATPDPPYNGWLENANWTRDSHIAISESSFAGAIIYPSHYFEGTETVTCNYTFGYYVAGRLTAGHLQKTFYITCKRVDGELSETQLNMTVGQKKRLNYYPSYSGYTSYTNKYVTWDSSNEDVVTVDKNGNVEAVGSGRALITFDPIGGPLLFCNVTVEYIEPTSISFKESSVSVVEGKTKTLSYTLEPKGASATVKWKSSNESVVKVSSTGKITGIAEGNATITVTTEKGLSANCTVNVVSAPKSVSLPNSADVVQGYNIQLNPTLTPVNSETTYKWKSDDTTIATVASNGKVTGKNTGTATITVTTENGLTATCKVTVRNAPQGADYRNANIRVKAIKDLVTETLKYIDK